MKSNRDKAMLLLDKMIDNGISERMILDYIIGDHLSGQEAYDVMVDVEKEFFHNPDDIYSDGEYDASSFDENEE